MMKEVITRTVTGKKKGVYKTWNKFLPDLNSLPFKPEDYPCRKIEQGYLCTSPVVRIRRDNKSFFLTYKSKGLMVREEYNLPLTQEAYEHLKPKIDGRLIQKKRYVIPLDGGLALELDIFEDSPFPSSQISITSDPLRLVKVTKKVFDSALREFESKLSIIKPTSIGLNFNVFEQLLLLQMSLISSP